MNQALAAHRNTSSRRNTVETRPPNSSEEPLEMKATMAHRRVIAELGLRFPCPRDTDPDEYGARLDFLAHDTAHLATGLLRKACDRAAQSARGLPYASEIIACATAIIEERQRVEGVIDVRAGGVDARAENYRRSNRDNADKGSPVRWTDEGEAFRIGAPGEKRCTRADGSVCAPWFGDQTQTWLPPTPEDADLMNASFERYGSPYRVRDGRVVRID